MPKEFVKLLFISLFCVSGLSCGGRDESGVEDFSTGLANRDERIKEGILYIQEYRIKKARSFFESLMESDEDHCGALVGLPLVYLQDYLDRLSFTLNAFMNSQIYSGPIFPMSDEVVEETEYCDRALDRIIRNTALDLHETVSKGLKLVQRAIKQGCEMELSYPIRLSAGPSFSFHIVLSGRFGEAELALLKYIGNFVLLIADIILTHDLSVNTTEILSNISKIRTSEAIGFVRSLGFIMRGCSRTLAFHPEDKIFMLEIPSLIKEVVSGALEFLSALEKREGRDNYVITFYDNSGDGRFGYDRLKTTIKTPQDQVKLQVGGVVRTGGTRATVREVRIHVPYIFTFEMMTEFQRVVSKVTDIIEKRKVGCPENCISVADLNFFLKAFGVYLEDFARFDIGKFIENPKPIRELLPYWFYNQRTLRWEFIVEAEVPESRADLRPYLFNHDSAHFFSPKYINFYGRIITDFSIPPDCVFVEELTSDLNWVLIPYILFQDPTFSGSLYVRLKGVFSERCNAIEMEYESEDWKNPNLYMTNKVIAMIAQKTGSIISPLADLILRSVEVVH